MNFEEYLKNKYGFNEPIYIKVLQFESYSRSWIFKELKNLVDIGELKRFDTGIYYFPTKMPWGVSYLNPRKVIQKRFLSDGDSVYGYIAGLSLKNQVGLSTQVPPLLEIVTNRESAQVRYVNVGPQKVRLRRARATITNENVNALQLLDLLSNITPNAMDETEWFMLSKYISDSGVTKSKIFKYIDLFPVLAMKNLMEIGII